EALERLEKIDTLVIDKTGTLTEGRPAVTAIRTAGHWTENEVLLLAASLERSSEHPLAEAILRAAQDRQLDLQSADDFDSPIGRGVTGTIAGQRVVLGGPRIMAEQNIDTTALNDAAEAMRAEGATAIFTSVD